MHYEYQTIFHYKRLLPLRYWLSLETCLNYLSTHFLFVCLRKEMYLFKQAKPWVSGVKSLWWLKAWRTKTWKTLRIRLILSLLKKTKNRKIELKICTKKICRIDRKLFVSCDLTLQCGKTRNSLSLTKKRNFVKSTF